MNESLAGALYLLAAVLFILGLKRLTSPASAAAGNRLSAVGMLIAVLVTLTDRQIVSFGAILSGLIIGSVAGVVLATRIQMTSMPQLVAAFNGFGGGASALVALAEAQRLEDFDATTGVTIAVSVAVGAVTLSGSFVAFGKLQALIPGKRIVMFGDLGFHLLLIVAGVAAAGGTIVGSGSAPWILAGVALVVGVTRTLPIGGADMPVVISILNSMSGLAASAAGFVIDSNTLIISGALVGASGLILTSIMVKAMNRTLRGVLFSAFTVASDGGVADEGDRHAVSGSPDDIAITLAYANSVVVVPGYGLAVAQAQHVIRELADVLTARGVDVRYAIHPVAGRMPGHMNVLLAEADVPYDRLFDLQDINQDFARTDVALVVGANDVVNPLARQESGPIAGMPILDVDDATTVIVVKRSLSPGFAGLDNPLFYEPNTIMLFADAREGLAEVVRSIRAL